MIKSSQDNIGSDYLDWIKSILTLKKDVTLSESKRMYERFKHQTPLLDAKKILGSIDVIWLEFYRSCTFKLVLCLFLRVNFFIK